MVVEVDGFTSMFRREYPRLVALGLALTGFELTDWIA